MSPTAERLTRELSRLLTEYEALFGDPTVICMGRARAREKLFRKGRELAAELAVPVEKTLRPWTPFNQRNACPEHKPGGGHV